MRAQQRVLLVQLAPHAAAAALPAAVLRGVVLGNVRRQLRWWDGWEGGGQCEWQGGRRGKQLGSQAGGSGDTCLLALARAPHRPARTPPTQHRSRTSGSIMEAAEAPDMGTRGELMPLAAAEMAAELAADPPRLSAMLPAGVSPVRGGEPPGAAAAAAMRARAAAMEAKGLAAEGARCTVTDVSGACAEAEASRLGVPGAPPLKPLKPLKPGLPRLPRGPEAKGLLTAPPLPTTPA